MKLTKARIREFQSVLDSEEFQAGEVTCLVGKNEAGKTAILQALYRLNPIVAAEGEYSVTDDYPRRDVEDYRLEVEAGQRQPATVAEATFELEDADVEVVAALIGQGTLVGRTVTLSKGYSNNLTLECEINDTAALKHLAAQHQCGPEVMAQLERCQTLSAAREILPKVEQTPQVAALNAKLQEVTTAGGFVRYIFDKALQGRVPKFLYFDEYYQMKGRANIEALKARMAAKPLASIGGQLQG